MLHHSKVYEALKLLGVTGDFAEVKTVMVGAHRVAITRHAHKPPQLDHEGNVATTTEFIDIDWTPTVITAPPSTDSDFNRLLSAPEVVAQFGQVPA